MRIQLNINRKWKSIVAIAILYSTIGCSSNSANQSSQEVQLDCLALQQVLTEVVKSVYAFSQGTSSNDSYQKILAESISKIENLKVNDSSTDINLKNLQNDIRSLLIDLKSNDIQAATRHLNSLAADIQILNSECEFTKQ